MENAFSYFRSDVLLPKVYDFCSDQVQPTMRRGAMIRWVEDAADMVCSCPSRECVEVHIASEFRRLQVHAPDGWASFQPTRHTYRRLAVEVSRLLQCAFVKSAIPPLGAPDGAAP